MSHDWPLSKYYLFNIVNYINNFVKFQDICHHGNID